MCGMIPSLADPERRALLGMARDTARRILMNASETPEAARPRIEGRFGGAFVTFWQGSLLRGCVGNFTPTADIAAAIEEATEASLHDPRFADDPITFDELPALTIELSLLTDPRPTSDPLSLTPGRHGIVIRYGGRSGCFLPKVAFERNWSAEEFLRNCCVMKAGLRPDAWRDPDATVLLFEAQSIRDDEKGRS